MSKYRIETDIDDFIERWLQRTTDWDDIIPATLVWDAMLHSAGLRPEESEIWGMNRNVALRYVRNRMYLTCQTMRYYRLPEPVRGLPPGYSAPCFERLKLSEYAVEALKSPMKVRPRAQRHSLVGV